jgi:hypothetical protein
VFLRHEQGTAALHRRAKLGHGGILALGIGPSPGANPDKQNRLITCARLAKSLPHTHTHTDLNAAAGRKKGRARHALCCDRRTKARQVNGFT